ncbi:protein CutA homolog isoform X2 [Phymastichus coffea]|uniref:protein CutA homolog isoform X2 n=1 Tax=Phymastichus coffea TaxID=108790 RepID=UPI00273B00E1|nr:protein CutA homolog isoform X2 [Phymastichus coffea]
MVGKPAIGLLTFLCFTRRLNAETVRTMSNYTGLHSVAYVTVPSEEIAKKLAHGIVSKKLAACVNIIPKITYEWKDEINEDNELLLMIKTRTDTVNALTEYVKKNHPYETSEVISLPIQNGNEAYLKWIGEIVPPIHEREAMEKKDK